VFRCQWIEDKHITVDNYEVRFIDLSKVGYKDDPWIMANRAAQVFYAQNSFSWVRHDGQGRIVAG
jgi:hypothetical protein